MERVGNMFTHAAVLKLIFMPHCLRQTLQSTPKLLLSRGMRGANCTRATAETLFYHTYVPTLVL
jgi:hypothetical protein